MAGHDGMTGHIRNLPLLVVEIVHLYIYIYIYIYIYSAHYAQWLASPRWLCADNDDILGYLSCFFYISNIKKLFCLCCCQYNIIQTEKQSEYTHIHKINLKLKIYYL